MNPQNHQKTKLITNELPQQKTSFVITFLKRLLYRILKAVILIIILIIVIASLNIVVRRYSKLEEMPTITIWKNPATTSQTISELTPTTAINIGWKKYESSDLGISISYPDTWIVERKKYESDQEYETLILKNADHPNDSSLCIGYDYCYSTSGDITANEPATTTSDETFDILGKQYPVKVLQTINSKTNYQRFILSFRLNNVNNLNYQPYIQSKTGTEKDLETVRTILSKIIYN